MINIKIFLFLVFLFSCNEGKRPILGDTDYQKQLNAKFKDATTSPLTKIDRKSFRGLDFFDFDSTFVVNAHLIRTPNSEYFNMKTTTNQSRRERVFGMVIFNIFDKNYRLNVYQGEENLQSNSLEDYLFLPFLDQTNGDESYDGGRYIDLRIPIGDSLIIDFNKAYNPYCHYNEKFSCPIVPRDNYLALDVTAGLKKYIKD